MKLRTLAVLVGALSIASAPFVLAVTGGGIPSFIQLLGLGLNTAPQTTVPITVQNLSPNVTAFQAKNDTAHDVEILATTSTAGNAQFRATNFGGANWAFGNLRSDNSFDICNAATLSTGCPIALATSGGLTQTATTSLADNFNATGAASTSQITLNANGTQIGLCISGTAGSCTTGDAAGDAGIRFDGTLRFGPHNGASILGSFSPAGVFNVKSGGDLQVNGTSACLSNGTHCPASTFGSISLQLGMAGAANPAVNFCNRCSSPSATRTGTGLYSVAVGVSAPSNPVTICAWGNGANPGALIINASNYNTTTVTFSVVNTSGTLTDPPNSSQVNCVSGN